MFLQCRLEEKNVTYAGQEADERGPLSYAVVMLFYMYNIIIYLNHRQVGELGAIILRIPGCLIRHPEEYHRSK